MPVAPRSSVLTCFRLTGVSATAAENLRREWRCVCCDKSLTLTLIISPSGSRMRWSPRRGRHRRSCSGTCFLYSLFRSFLPIAYIRARPKLKLLSCPRSVRWHAQPKSSLSLSSHQEVSPTAKVSLPRLHWVQRLVFNIISTSHARTRAQC